MRKSFFRLLAPVICMAFASPASADQSQTSPQANRAGEARTVVPVGQILRGMQAPLELKKLDPVLWRDIVQTQKGGRARIALDDGSILNIGSESQLQIVEHDAAGQRTTIQLLYGRIRSKAVQLSKPGAEFNVKTPVATAGVVGTRFVVRHIGDLTEVFCLEGTVLVGNINVSIPGKVTLKPGEFTRVMKGAAPLPAAPASPQDLSDVESETNLPIENAISRVEVSAPPPGCGEQTTLTARAWRKLTVDAKETEREVEGEEITGTLRLGGQPIWVEGGRAILTSALPPENSSGEFTPARAASAMPVKVWAAQKLEDGANTASKEWRAPRAAFAGSVFYVLGPMGVRGRPEFAFGAHPASLLWQGVCGAGFLAPATISGTYEILLRIQGTVAARGTMNLIAVLYQLPVPPSVLKGQESKFGISIRGLEGLDAFTNGRPVMTTTVTNHTPTVIGSLRPHTQGGSSTGNGLMFVIRGAAGVVQLDASGRGVSAGMFSLGVDHKLDPELEQPKTKMTAIEK
ncbi:MAG: FecR domain-containing protein [Acidobacteria bacterium]|nr:FecR domain-containing protein [Acidobacteriota bacterium]